ncbi:unnamed protein product, partial [Didymodactylos carnosus]
KSSSLIHVTNLGILPNELLLEIFEYLNAIDLLFAFLNLNSQIDRLFESYQYLRLNFQYVQKTKLNWIYNRLNVKQIQPLTLSNNNDDTYVEIFLIFNPYHYTI